VILIDNGKVLQDNLKKTRINIDELRGHLRYKNVLDLSTVQYAILETNGSISVFPYPKNAPASAKDAGVQASAQYMPVAVVSDGKVLSANLTAAGKNRAWLSSTLNRYHANVENTWLLTVDGADKVVYIPKEAAK
jgi:uncharacterized membrane protein YcaP (DUF421 family)